MVQDCEEFRSKRETSVRVSGGSGAGVRAGQQEVGQEFDGSAGGGQECEGFGSNWGGV